MNKINNKGITSKHKEDFSQILIMADTELEVKWGEWGQLSDQNKSSQSET